MRKIELREQYLKKRSCLDKIEVNARSNKIFDHLLSSDLANMTSIHVFLPMEKFNEINTWILINHCWQNNIKVYCPRVDGNELHHFNLAKDTDLAVSHFGILEPRRTEIPICLEELQQIQLIIVPLLIADKLGNRVGYGKGYYDRFLSQTPNSIRAGISFFPPIEQISDVLEHDIPLDYLFIPDGGIAWKRSSNISLITD